MRIQLPLTLDSIAGKKANLHTHTTLSDGKLDYLPDEILHYPWPEEEAQVPE